jgi:hypothetical protein
MRDKQHRLQKEANYIRTLTHKKQVELQDYLQNFHKKAIRHYVYDQIYQDIFRPSQPQSFKGSQIGKQESEATISVFEVKKPVGIMFAVSMDPSPIDANGEQRATFRMCVYSKSYNERKFMTTDERL